MPFSAQESFDTLEMTSTPYLALLEFSRLIGTHRTLEDLFRDLAQRLHPIVNFSYLSVLLHDEERDVMRVHILETDGPESVRLGMEFSMDESPSGWVWRRANHVSMVHFG